MEDTVLYSGRKLKEIRISRGIELEEMVESTKIRKSQLINIEDENYDELPAKVFLKGFLISYANHLDLNSKKVAEDILNKVEAETLKNVDNETKTQYSEF